MPKQTITLYCHLHYKQQKEQHRLSMCISIKPDQIEYVSSLNRSMKINNALERDIRACLSKRKEFFDQLTLNRII